jgi:hypothetical protein
MRLSEAIPEHLRHLPVPLAADELVGLQRVLTSGRVSTFRLVSYVCPKGHRLAEVLKAPEGSLLIIHVREPEAEGLSGDPRRPWTVKWAAGRWRQSAWVMRVADLEIWREALPGTRDFSDECRCRCGRHHLEMLAVSGDIAKDRRRVVLPRVMHTA